MFTENNAAENAAKEGNRRGRPRGRTEHGEERREELYQAAIGLIGEKGYDGTTMREIAEKAGVSPGLLYKYFPGKHAVVLHLYDELSDRFAQRAAQLHPGTWRERFLFALKTSLDTIRPSLDILSALVPVLIGKGEENLFAPGTAFSRLRVQAIFTAAVTEAKDAPKGEDAEVLARLLYVLHLMIILNLLLDKSPRRRSTVGMIDLLEKALPLGALALRLKPVRRLMRLADKLLQESLFGAGNPAKEVS